MMTAAQHTAQHSTATSAHISQQNSAACQNEAVQQWQQQPLLPLLQWLLPPPIIDQAVVDVG
jgi:hypothetical protein